MALPAIALGPFKVLYFLLLDLFYPSFCEFCEVLCEVANFDRNSALIVKNFKFQFQKSLSLKPL